jgi:hypothetical protein
MIHTRTITCPSPLAHAPAAVTHVRKLNGSSQPSIVKTTAAVPYVVKFSESTGKNGLMSEAIGSELMTLMGLPVPKWDPILFTDAFIDAHPDMWRRSDANGTGIRPEAGPHFGSRLTLSAEPYYTYDLIPSSWIDRISNRQDFVGALLLDLWTNNCDRRQCIFLTDGSKALRAVFIDNDHMFGGYFGNEKTCPRRAMVPDANFYRGVWSDPVVDHWKRVIDAIDDRCIDSILPKIPEEWADSTALKFALNELAARRNKLDLLIADADETIASGRFPDFGSPRCVGMSRFHEAADIAAIGKSCPAKPRPA